MIDLLIIFLLILSIWYCHGLHARINELQKGKLEFNKMLKEFDSAILRAEASVMELNKLSQNTHKKIQDAVSKAESLSNDLNFMNDMSEDIVKKLELTLSNARELHKQSSTHSMHHHHSPTKNDIEAILNIIKKT